MEATPCMFIDFLPTSDHRGRKGNNWVMCSWGRSSKKRRIRAFGDSGPLELELEKPRLARNFCSSLGFVVDLRLASFSFLFLLLSPSGLSVVVADFLVLTIGLISLLIRITSSEFTLPTLLAASTAAATISGSSTLNTTFMLWLWQKPPTMLCTFEGPDVEMK